MAYKKIIVWLCSIAVILLPGCEKNIPTDDEVSDYIIFPDKFSNIEVKLELPYIEDFEYFERECINNFQDFSPFYKWQTVSENGGKVLKCVDYDENEELWGHRLCFMIGDKSWRNYKFSFDFKCEDGSFVTFSSFADTNADNNTPDFFESNNPWFLLIDSNGVLQYRTVFTHNSHYIGDISEVLDEAGNKMSKPIEGFIKGEWNSVELFPVGLELHMTVNGKSIGKVAELNGNETGRVSIGGGVGCMFDNLKIEYVQ
jgi:hypothetical protein